MRKFTKQVRAAVRSVIGAPARANRQKAAPFRHLADEARDRGDWSAAAAAYRDYLELVPSDFGIWVQYGHALKEDRRLAEADHAYGRAMALKPHDPDLLMNYGHLKKMRDNLKEAARLYGLSAKKDPTAHALLELSSPALRQFLTEDDDRLLDVQAGKALASRCSGLTLLNSNDIVFLGGDTFAMVSDDPWLQFKPDRSTQAATTLAELEIRMSASADGSPVIAQLFVDYGDGYVVPHCLTFNPSGVETATVLRLAAPDRIRTLRIDPTIRAGRVDIQSITYRPDVTVNAFIDALLQSEADDFMTSDHFKSLRRRIEQTPLSATDAMALTRELSSDELMASIRYAAWNRRWIDPSDDDRRVMAEMIGTMKRRPTFSFVVPVYNTPSDLLIECMESMLAQTYPDFEICIADDNSPNPDVSRTLKRYANDPRVKIVQREYNGHISAASNSALDLATGDFVVLVDHDDVIPDYALFVVAHYLNLHPQARILFSDEDKITPEGERFTPYFKGAFDPYLLYGHNMVSHLGVYCRELLESIGGFRLGLEGSQDYDLLLRAFEKVGEAAVVHIPHVLYHWRAIPGSTAISADQKGYAIFAAKNAINAHFTRTGKPLLSVDAFAPGNTAVVRTRNFDTPVSIIIPTRDGLDDLRACVDSILAFDHRATEILVVDNGSEEPDTLAYLDALSRSEIARVIAYPGPFNFSDINNVAAAEATGDILCFLNNDTEVVTPDWIDRARALLSLGDVGMVGARLLYPDGAIQHFGVTVGAAKHGVAAHPHCGLPGSSSGYFSKARLMQQFSAVTAACMFVTKEAFTAAGGFDPELRVAYNDVDLCLKVRREGFKIVCDPDIVLVHKESRTRGSDEEGDKARRLDAEAATMRARWADVLDHDPFYSPNHDLARTDFALANPPRVPMPWKSATSPS